MAKADTVAIIVQEVESLNESPLELLLSLQEEIPVFHRRFEFKLGSINCLS